MNLLPRAKFFVTASLSLFLLFCQTAETPFDIGTAEKDSLAQDVLINAAFPYLRIRYLQQSNNRLGITSMYSYVAARTIALQNKFW